MRNEAHLEALKAAARLTMSAAMSVAVLGGCTAAAEETGDDAEKTESDVSAKKPAKQPKKGPSVSDACHKDAGPPKLTCDQILASAFPDGGNGWFGNEEKKLSPDELACCTEEIKAAAKDETGLNRGQHHWACCTATNWGQGIPDIGLACTPWGPPVPPAMNRKKAHPPVDAWMHEGVA